jgi:thiamine-monophosphate kinase
MTSNNPLFINHLNPLSEFSFIQYIRAFAEQQFASASETSLLLGINDDCALFDYDKTQHKAWAISKDLLLEGRHFFKDITPQHLGHKALAVNLSDLAAMGATPRFFLLGLALPSMHNIEWLKNFMQGIFALAQKHGCILIGGDTTKSEHGVQISITVIGEVDTRYALKRNQAQIGDDIWISGTLGDARLLLGHKYQEYALENHAIEQLTPKLELPTPRIELGQKLLNIAHAAIDISDGLIGDLSHILKQSNVKAELHIDKIPRSSILLQQNIDMQKLCTLAGGDDYELCFTVPTKNFDTILDIEKELGIPLHCVGKIISSEKNTSTNLNDTHNYIDYFEYNQKIQLDANTFKGFDHFN